MFNALLGSFVAWSLTAGALPGPWPVAAALALGGALIGWMLAGGGYDAAAKTQNSATLTIIIALFTLVPAVCYLLSAVIAKRYYTLKTPFLKKMMAELAEGARRNEQDFTAAPIDKEWQN